MIINTRWFFILTGTDHWIFQQQMIWNARDYAELIAAAVAKARHHMSKRTRRK